MSRKIMLVSIVAIIIVAGVVFILAKDKTDTVPTQNKQNYTAAGNTPLQNKQIELKAFQQKDDSICETIIGESYNFGPIDEQVSISQSEARAQCHQNIKNGNEPVLHGG